VDEMKRVTILGSTGSIGKNTLEVLSSHPDKFDVFALTAKSSLDDLFFQCQKYEPPFAVLEEELLAIRLRERIQQAKLRTDVLWGVNALQDVASHPDVDYVMAAMVGAAGLLPILAAAKSGKRILLANKESLIMSGQLLLDTVNQYGATLLPVDSEHNAIFQCMPANYLPGHNPLEVETIILTASGGPFRTLPLSKFGDITREQAISHPIWKMGSKISVDSATLMNKGFEVIEAYWLFNVLIEQIEVVIHPQSIIHSMVTYQDGSILAQLGPPDMQIPIAYTLSWPKRIKTNLRRLNLIEISQLTFEPVDSKRFPCLKLAYQALKEGGSASTLLNAANEIAVAAFLENRIGFLRIPTLISDVLERLPVEPIDSVEAILEVDDKARRLARQLIEI
jgi:1-deoxy-D-xylulose-5-phosphate reductoisomerase